MIVSLGMDWQLTISLSLVFLASCYLAWRGVRVWSSRKKDCGGGCGCSAPAPGGSKKQEIVPISLDRMNRRPRTPGQG